MSHEKKDQPGEGNRAADQRYRKGASEFADSEEAKKAAREAADETEKPAKPTKSPLDPPKS